MQNQIYDNGITYYIIDLVYGACSDWILSHNGLAWGMNLLSRGKQKNQLN